MPLNASKLKIERIRELLDIQYGLSCNRVVTISNGSANLYHIFSNDGEYILKEFQNGFDIDRVKMEIEITKIIKNEGIPTTDFVYNFSNRAYLLNEGNIITLQRYINGITKDYYSLDEKEQIEVADYLVKIIKILNHSNIQLPSFKMDIFELRRIIESVDKCNNLLCKCKDNVMIKSLKDKKKMLIEASMMDFSHINDLTILNSHGDYNISQFIYNDKGKIKAILDFASAKRLPIVWELLRSYIFMDSTYNNGVFSLNGLIKYLRMFNKDKILNKYDIEYFFKVYYMFLLNSMFGFEQYIENNNSIYYQIGMNLYHQSKYLNKNMNEMSKILHKRKMEVL